MVLMFKKTLNGLNCFDSVHLILAILHEPLDLLPCLIEPQ